MKLGIKKPSLKKSIKARTTGNIKRSIKRSVNPLYGKKGMGYLNNPKKALYNKVYNKTTIGVSDLVNSQKNKYKKEDDRPVKYSSRTYKIAGILGMVFGGFTTLLGLISLPVGGIIFAIGGILLFSLGFHYKKISKKIDE